LRISQPGRNRRQFKHPIEPGRVTVSGKPSHTVPPGTLRSFRKQAGWDDSRGSAMRRYGIVVADARSNLAASVPDLPGQVATGESEEEAGRLSREVIALHLEGLEEDGLPIPEPSSRVKYVEVDA
jgi:predicted RNase H-like HicB family nuclease